MICKYICWKRGYKIKNPENFAAFTKSPGIPDIFISYECKAKNDYNHLVTVEKSVCIEIETDPTPANNLKKAEQFTRPGVEEPIIIDMNKGYENFKARQKEKNIDYPSDIERIAAYIEYKLVL